MLLIVISAIGLFLKDRFPDGLTAVAAELHAVIRWRPIQKGEAVTARSIPITFSVICPFTAGVGGLARTAAHEPSLTNLRP